MDTIFEVIPWVRSNGNIPFEEAVFVFNAASADLTDKFLAHVSKLEFKSMHSGLSIEKFEDHLWCLRVRRRNQYARLFFTFTPNRKIILLNGFLKKTKKTPLKELAMARKLLSEVNYA